MSNDHVDTAVIEGPDSTGTRQARRRPGETADARLLDLHGAAAYLGISYWTMRDLVNGGQVPSVRIPSARARDGRTIRRTLIDRRDLDAFIERNKEAER
jgi:hypothetical protein